MQRPRPGREEAEVARREKREKSRKQNDKPARGLSPLEIGQRVYLQGPASRRWKETAVITAVREHGRSYEIEREGGKLTVRNRRFIRPVPE